MAGSSFGYADLCRFAKGNVVSREHLEPRTSFVAVLAQYGIRKIVLHVRDPRAVMVPWTEHIDRNLARRGLRSVSLFCERDLPSDYLEWDFSQRLQWQVEHVMPRFVHWIEQWLDLAENSTTPEFLITTYNDFARDNRKYIERVRSGSGRLRTSPARRDGCSAARRARSSPFFPRPG
jgi:hypothetical protein